MRAGAWDAVVTCFFLDTAHNIVEYIKIISKILKDGGVSSQLPSSSVKYILLQKKIIIDLFGWQVWINLGPLLYHFADMYGQDVST